MKEELLKYLKESHDFVLDQAPDIFAQLVKMKIIMYATSGVVSFICAFILAFIFIGLFKKRKTFPDFAPGWDKTSSSIAMGLTALGFCIFFFALATDIYSCIVWNICPKASMLNMLLT